MIKRLGEAAPPRGLFASEPPSTLYLRPAGLMSGAVAERAIALGHALPLAGGAFAFAAVAVTARRSTGERWDWDADVGTLRDWVADESPALAEGVARRLDALTKPRAATERLVGRGPGGVALMGIVNVTPDSFSDEGAHSGAEAAIDHGHRLAEAGAAILDVGGESTRPGAETIAVQEELDRVIPVIEALSAAGRTVSVDTRKAPVMRAAVSAGARLINDVSGLAYDPDAPKTAAELAVPVVLMHMRGGPETMRDLARYDDPLLEVYDELEAALGRAMDAGIGADALLVDPGIGFAKTLPHNLAVLGGLALYHGLGCPIVLGVSRKSMIADIAGPTPPLERVPGSLAAALAGVAAGAQILRVHDVAETAQAVRVWRAIEDARAENQL